MYRVPRRRTFRVRRRFPAALLPLLLVAVLTIGVFIHLNSRLLPYVETMAVSKATNLISQAVSEETDLSLAAEQLSYDDFVSATWNDAGRVASLSLNISQCTAFKHIVIDQLISRLENTEPTELSVPMGTFTNVLFVSDRGPSVQVRLQSVGDVTAEFSNELTSAGVNQTRHSVYLDVAVTVYLLIPGEIIPVTVEERVCVAETVIVGEVPDTYLNLQNGVD